jgi:hypothetical protein
MKCTFIPLRVSLKKSLRNKEMVSVLEYLKTISPSKVFKEIYFENDGNGIKRP